MYLDGLAQAICDNPYLGLRGECGKQTLMRHGPDDTYLGMCRNEKNGLECPCGRVPGYEYLARNMWECGKHTLMPMWASYPRQPLRWIVQECGKRIHGPGFRGMWKTDFDARMGLAQMILTSE